MKNKFKNFNKQLIIDDYSSKTPLKVLSKKYNISVAMIYKLLDKYNIDRKGGGVRKYFFNQNYFDIINTPDKAYFLGWLYSDGNNYPSSGHIQLSIQEEDIKILNLFSNYISEGICNIRKIKKKEGKNQVCLKLSSMYMSKKLIELGCVPAKSLVLKFPTEEQVPNYLVSHFIRGYFDGDGCITSYKGKKDKNPNYQFLISGTKEVLEKIQEELMKNLSLSKTKLIKNKNIFNLCYGGNKQVKRIYDYLYKDCEDLFLIRKKEKFQYFNK